MVGNALATATIFAGTVVRLMVISTMLPTPVLLAPSKALVAMAGTKAGSVLWAESETCAATGSVTTGDASGACDQRPNPGVNVRVAPPGARCQPVTRGPSDGPYIFSVDSSETSSGELATAVHVLGVAPATVRRDGSPQPFRGQRVKRVTWLNRSG